MVGYLKTLYQLQILLTSCYQSSGRGGSSVLFQELTSVLSQTVRVRVNRSLVYVPSKTYFEEIPQQQYLFIVEIGTKIINYLTMYQ